jgi:hypothetical protein
MKHCGIERLGLAAHVQPKTYRFDNKNTAVVHEAIVTVS